MRPLNVESNKEDDGIKSMQNQKNEVIKSRNSEN